MLEELDRLSAARASFAFESTLSGLAYIERLDRMRQQGYEIEIVFLKLNSPELAIKRVSHRVKHGGHGVPEVDVRRRFARGLHNFEKCYKRLAHTWHLYENSGSSPVLIEKSL